MSHFDLKSCARAILVLALSACSERAPEPTKTAAAPPPDRSQMHAVQPFADLDSAASAAIAMAMADDRGIVFPVMAAPPTGTPPRMVLREDGDEGAPIVAYLDFQTRPEGGWSEAMRAVKPDLYGQLTRVSHDDYGMPADSVRAGWAQVVYGYTRAGEEQRAWVRLKRDSVQLATYDSLMTAYPSWFTDPSAVTFYEQPNGPAKTFSLDPSYGLSVQAVLGPWIRVHVTVPDTTECSGDPAAMVERRATLWVPRVNKNRQRQIWSAVAGC